MLEITTCHISQMDKHRGDGVLVLDVTVKSSTGKAKDLAPEWSWVMGYKDARITKEEYTELYMKKLRAAQEKFPERWVNTIRKYKKLVFACYCKPGDFCHRILLAAEFKSYAKKIGVDARIIPEGPTTPTTPPRTLPTEQSKTGDGVDHINIYSKGETPLGKWMSNFAGIVVELEGREFHSIEGYWYWLGTDTEPENKSDLQDFYGFKAKQMGKQLQEIYGKAYVPDFQEKICAALRAKVASEPRYAEMLKESTLPFRHYYVYGGKQVDAGYEWQVEEWEDIRAELKGEVPPRRLYHGHEGTQVLEEPRYAGVGSRKTPERILKLMTDYAANLSYKGYILRSGGAEGADSAFELGCDNDAGQKEIFRSGDAAPWAKQLVQKYLPAGRDWNRMSSYVQGLLARNMMQMLGYDGDKPVEFVVCWTEDGKDSGGTGYIIRAALDHSIPVYNLRNVSEHKAFREKVLGLNSL